MAEYKIISRKMFAKDSAFQEVLNLEARNGWRVISIGYANGDIAKAVFERTNNNQ